MSARNLRELPSADWERLEEVVARFEQAWRAGLRPALLDFLAVEPPLRQAVLVELIHADMEFRCLAGEPFQAATYLQEYPTLAADRSVVLELLRREFDLRRERDPRLAPAGFAEQYPDYRDDLLAHLAGGNGSAANRGSETVDLPTTIGHVDPQRPATPIPERAALRRNGYEVLGLLGRGGMGVVYQARQVRLKRLVALKMILNGVHADPAELGRFRTEAEAAARLQHPNIVQIYEVGELDGRPYLALEYVEGGSLAQRLTGAPLPPGDAARLAERLARAVQAAHERGVVHRDLKPANILLDAQQAPKITDFGLAKQLDDDDSAQTRSGAIMGTPCYMAPEQASGKVRAIGPAADIYALGAVLYEMLTGRPPFRGATVLDTLEQVRSQEPVPPGRLQPKLPRDLDTITLKCLAKEPAQRYASAHDLAEDLRRHLAGEPILARPVGPGERLLKWARRRPAIAALVASLIVVTLTGFTAVLYQLNETREALELADGNRRTAEENAEKETIARKLRDRHLYAARANLIEHYWEKHDSRNVASLLNQQEPQAGQDDLRGWEWHFYQRLVHGALRTFGVRRGYLGVQLQDLVDKKNQPGALVSLVVDQSPASKAGVLAGDVITRVGSQSVMDRSELQRLVVELPLGKPVAVSLLRDGKAMTVQVTIAEQPGSAAVRAVAFSPDGSRLATASSMVNVWDTSTGQELYRITKHRSAVTCVAYSPGGRYLASISHDGTVGLWHAADGRPVRELAHPAFVYHQYTRRIAFSPDGQWLASGGGGPGSEIKVWEVETGREVNTLKMKGAHVTGLAFSPDGRHIAWSDRHFGSPRLWELATGRQVPAQPGTSVTALAFSPNGRLLFSSGEGEVIVWDLQAARALHRFKVRSVQDGVAFSPDGRLVAAAGHDGDVKVWDSASGDLLGSLARNYWSTLACVAFSPDGRLIAAGGYNGLHLWDLAGLRESAAIPTTNHSVSQVVFSPDGQQVALADDAVVKLYDAATRQVLRAFPRHSNKASGLAFRPDGRVLASASAEHGKSGEIKLWDLANGNVLLTIPNVPSGPSTSTLTWACGLAFSPDGKWLASAGPDSTIKLWDAGSGQEARTFRGHQDVVFNVAFSRDGRWLASASRDGTVRVWEAASGQESRALRASSAYAFGVAFNSDGSLLGVTGFDETLGAFVKVWDWRSGTPARSFAGHSNYTTGVAFSPDGRRLATTGGGFGNPSEMKIWDPVSGQEVATFYEHDSTSSGVAFSPDGCWLAFAGTDGIKLRDARPLTPEIRLEREAVELLDYLIGKPLPKSEVRERVRHDPTISEAVRDEALKLLDRYQEMNDRRRYLAASRYLTQQAYLSAIWYREALVQAEFAVSRAPKDATAYTALGMAQYRAGQYREAIKTLTRAEQLTKSVPANLAFLAMSHQRLDERARSQAQLSQALGLTPLVEDLPIHRKAAEACLEQLRQAIQQPRWAGDAQVPALLQEAETLISPPSSEPSR